MALNGKTFKLRTSTARIPKYGAPVIHPTYSGPKVEIYHPTKGWRFVSPKRMRAQDVMQRSGLRGHAIAAFIKDEFRARIR